MLGKWTRWLGLVVVAVALMALMAPITNADGLDVTVNMRSNGGFVDLAPGQTLHVNLPRLDGYVVWTVTAYDSTILRLRGSNAIAPSSFAFTAVRPGLTTIKIAGSGRGAYSTDFTLQVLVMER